MSALQVSCVMAVYNGEKYLREAINSVLAQSYPNVELVVVDDGSTDASVEIAASYGDQLNFVVQRNAGVSVARNNGVDASNGVLLSFLDADDCLHPDKMLVQAELFAHRPELDLCDCYSENFWSPELDRQIVQDDPRDRTFIGKRDHGHISSWMLRRELFFSVGRFTPGMIYAEDVDFFSRCRDSGACFETLPDVLTRRRLHLSNVTSHSRRSQGDALASAMKAHLDRVRGSRGRR